MYFEKTIRRRIDGDVPSDIWASLFDYFWPSYKVWFLSEGIGARPTYAASRNAIATHMPELVTLYENACEAAGGGDIAARFLSMYCPPAYATGCSQAVFETPTGPQLIRNYDYHPSLFEGVCLQTHWMGKRVNGVSDGVWGLLDGINEDGLVASLSFGGRRNLGHGFGVPLILRYVLQVCTNVAEATEALQSVPSHMAYNVTLLDRNGNRATVEIAPDGVKVLEGRGFAVNHQSADQSWTTYLETVKSHDRERVISDARSDQYGTQQMIDMFRAPPFFSTLYSRSFGTLYTSLYAPGSGTVQIILPQTRFVYPMDAMPVGNDICGYFEPETALAT